MYQDGSFAEGYAIGRDSTNNNNNGWGNDGAWWIVVLLALFGGWGNGFGGGFGNGFGGNFAGYELGKVATQADVASGFANSATLNSLNDLKLGQAGVQQTLCQGFSGVNNAIERNGYETQLAVNTLGYRLQDCCCQTQRSIDNVNFNMAKNTCDIIRAGQDNTRQILDFLTNDKIASLQHENATLTAQLSQNAQTRTLIDTLLPVARPAYITCSPYASAFGHPYANNGCGCNNCGM